MSIQAAMKHSVTLKSTRATYYGRTKAEANRKALAALVSFWCADYANDPTMTRAGARGRATRYGAEQ